MPRKRSTLVVPLLRADGAVDAPVEACGFIRLDITERQLEVLTWVERGKSATDIGTILGISHRTVEHHLEKACTSLGVRTRLQAVLKVRDLGLIGPSNG